MNVWDRQLPEDIVAPLRSHLKDRRQYGERRNDAERDVRHLVDLQDEIELLLIAAERQQIDDLYCLGKIRDEARRRIERELDLRDAQLANVQSDE